MPDAAARTIWRLTAPIDCRVILFLIYIIDLENHARAASKYTQDSFLKIHRPPPKWYYRLIETNRIKYIWYVIVRMINTNPTCCLNIQDSGWLLYFWDDVSQHPTPHRELNNQLNVRTIRIPSRPNTAKSISFPVITIKKGRYYDRQTYLSTNLLRSLCFWR